MKKILTNIMFAITIVLTPHEHPGSIELHKREKIQRRRIQHIVDHDTHARKTIDGSDCKLHLQHLQQPNKRIRRRRTTRRTNPTEIRTTNQIGNQLDDESKKDDEIPQNTDTWNLQKMKQCSHNKNTKIKPEYEEKDQDLPKRY